MSSEPVAAPSLTLEQGAALAASIRDELKRVIVGQDQVLDETLLGLLAHGHVLLEGVPGLGKTLLVRSLAQVLELSFARVQFTPDLMPADIVGTEVLVEAERGGRELRFRPGPVFAQIVLADEINRATPKTQSALLEAMQERSVTAGGRTLALPQPFFVLATENPIEMEGTFPLPEAQLDRFLLKIRVPFPSREELSAIVDRTTGTGETRLEKRAGAAQLIALHQLVRGILVAPEVKDYALRLVLATHPELPAAAERVRRFVRHGASPRAAQALLLAGKARALLLGRANLGFADIRAVALPALRHRVLLSFEGEAQGLDPDRLVGELLAELPEVEGERGREIAVAARA